MTMINKEEYELLKSLDDQWKWIARDEKETYESFYSNQVMAYRTRPNKDNWLNIWSSGSGGACLPEELFRFIKWEDGEPYNIAWLLGEYEEAEYGYFNNELYERFYEESEETEVKKDLEWAMEEIKKERNLPNDTGVLLGLKKALNILNQLDEPEPQNITLQDITHRLWELSLNNRKHWLEKLNNEFQEGYIVPLGLKTTDGEEQYLTYNGSYFASRRNRCLQQTFATLEEIPEFYRDLAERVL